MGILIFVNCAPMIWMSKRTNTVESCTFGSEIVAMRNAVDIIEGLRYKLRRFGVDIDGPTNVFCDNEAVTKNCGIPESTLKKKHHSINYHRNRESVSSKRIRRRIFRTCSRKFYLLLYKMHFWTSSCTKSFIYGDVTRISPNNKTFFIQIPREHRECNTGHSCLQRVNRAYLPG
jgi:hypothetical protein